MAVFSAERFLGGATDALLARHRQRLQGHHRRALRAATARCAQRLIQFLDSADGPKLAAGRGIELAQKLLDRILFIAFAQRTDLLPDRLLERAADARNEFRPEPIWQNFLRLFRSVDEGNPDLDILAYNGGLFAPIRSSTRSSCRTRSPRTSPRSANGTIASDVPVTRARPHLRAVDHRPRKAARREPRRAAAEGLQAQARGRRLHARHRHALPGRAHHRADACPSASRRCLAKHGKTDAGQRRSDPRGATSETSSAPSGANIRRRCARLRIVDPACGSGAFLVAAFDLLAAEYRRVVERLAVLGEPIDFDPFDEIVTRNLHGVDLNAESVEITRLALWLKTARSQHRLQNLEATIKVGNSLIDDPSLHRASVRLARRVSRRSSRRAASISSSATRPMCAWS